MLFGSESRTQPMTPISTVLSSENAIIVVASKDFAPRKMPTTTPWSKLQPSLELKLLLDKNTNDCPVSRVNFWRVSPSNC